MELVSRDIHNHILPGVDDGFAHVADSLEAIKTMAARGCKEFVFTPHMNPDVYPDMTEAIMRKTYADFVQKIPAEWGVSTALAAEYMVVNDFEERAEHPEELLTFSDGSILIEMSYFFRSSNLEQALFDLNLAGLNPILAHPERYLYMVGCRKDFERFQDMGCRFQINYASLTGKYGPDSLKILDYLFDQDMVSFVSSDLHSLSQLDSILDSTPVRKIRKGYEKFLASL